MTISLVHPYSLIDLDIFKHPVPLGGLGDGDGLVLNRPSEEDLGRSHVQALGNVHDRHLVQDGSLAQGAVALELDLQLLTIVTQRLWVVIGMKLDLVDVRQDTGRLDQVVQVIFEKVGDANAAATIRLQEQLHASPSLLQHLLLVHAGLDHGAVDQEEVQVVGLEGPGRLQEGFAGGSKAVIIRPELGGQEDLLSGHLAIGDGLTNERLRSIPSSCVDESIIALVQGIKDCVMIVSAIMSRACEEETCVLNPDKHACLDHSATD